MLGKTRMRQVVEALQAAEARASATFATFLELNLTFKREGLTPIQQIQDTARYTLPRVEARHPDIAAAHTHLVCPGGGLPPPFAARSACATSFFGLLFRPYNSGPSERDWRRVFFLLTQSAVTACSLLR